MGAKISREMKRALKMIIEGGKTAKEAAEKCGITQGAISQNADYRAFKDGKKGAANGKVSKA
jgi:hypothetical protein